VRRSAEGPARADVRRGTLGRADARGRLADPWRIVGVSLYSLTLVLLYGLSTLYHSVRGRAKAALQKIDHQRIYLLIAGSYTPFCG
jgi:channel protein (hemolysin III family)